MDDDAQLNKEQPTNVRIVIQAENLLLLKQALEHINRGFNDHIKYQAEIRQNSRIPFPKGVHTVLSLSLPEEVKID